MALDAPGDSAAAVADRRPRRSRIDPHKDGVLQRKHGVEFRRDIFPVKSKWVQHPFTETIQGNIVIARHVHSRNIGQTVQKGSSCKKLFFFRSLSEITTDNDDVRTQMSGDAQDGLSNLSDERWTEMKIRKMQDSQESS